MFHNPPSMFTQFTYLSARPPTTVGFGGWSTKTSPPPANLAKGGLVTGDAGRELYLGFVATFCARIWRSNASLVPRNSLRDTSPSRLRSILRIQSGPAVTFGRFV